MVTVVKYGPVPEQKDLMTEPTRYAMNPEAMSFLSCLCCGKAADQIDPEEGTIEVSHFGNAIHITSRRFCGACAEKIS